MNKIISIDHGNRMIKTPGVAFPAGYIESSHLPSMDSDVLSYKEKEYSLSDRLLGQRNDKASDESYFILTLFAIGKEIFESDDKPEPGEVIDIQLLIGLPPLHFKAMYKNFERYFLNRGQVSFWFNKVPFNIKIVGAQAFPQAYAAALTVFDQIKDYQIVNIIDIGGYTVDCMQLVNHKVNMDVCTSMYSGINLFFQKINEQVRATGARDIAEITIESILQNDPKVEGHRHSKMVKEQARIFASSLISHVASAGLDLIEDRTVFVGGGSILFREYLEEDRIASKPLFVNDPHANAKGYQIIYDKQKAQA